MPARVACFDIILKPTALPAARHSIAALSCRDMQPRVYIPALVEKDSEAPMDPAADLQTVILADYLVPFVLVLALAMQWLLHQVTERMSRWHILLPGLVTTAIWVSAGWMIGGLGGVATFVLGTAASILLAVVDDRLRRARDAAHPGEGVRFS